MEKDLEPERSHSKIVDGKHQHTKQTDDLILWGVKSSFFFLSLLPEEGLIGFKGCG